ncbi:TRAP transporter, 4TM/12TM fusion protein [Ruminococcaceae bacterium D5]|nr:TRAP transporter, 4TM/12TM fusion protein [Ruminococcaceae bacterium D5]
MSDIDKKEETLEAAAETGALDESTAEKLQEIMEKYDRESNVRKYTRKAKVAVRSLLIAFTTLCILMNLVFSWEERIRRPLFLGFAVVLVFLVFPAKKGSKRVNHIPLYDIVMILATLASYLYFVINFRAIINRGIMISQTEIILGIIGILVAMEACRRAVGIPLLVVASAFILYAFASGDYSLRLIIYNLFYTTTGLIGTPISVCSTYVVLFVIFGAFLEKTGISDFFIQLANSIAGSSSGGPAKVAVISSALCGMVSGSSVGNTVTTGAVTIPLMKRTGYQPEFAGAVEAAASTGGQIMPPIMGAAAFLMAEMAGVPYGSIIARAILPAALYFSGIFIMVHLEAKRLGLRGIPREELPNFFALFKRSWYLLFPLVLLVWMILEGRTMSRSAMVATVACIAVSMVRKESRMTLTTFLDALEGGARSSLSVAVACGVAGLISGVITMTGLGQSIITEIVKLSGGHLIIAMFLTMITCIVLGMGVPTTANYIIMATTCAPILTRMGIPMLAAHMFVFYFGIVADITPPVALAAYAGSAIAGSRPMKTAINATRLAIAAFIVPYIFGLNPAMLFIFDEGTSTASMVMQIVQIVITSFVGLFGVSCGIERYVYTKVPVWRAALLIVGGLLMINPGTITDLIGLVLVVGLLLLQRRDSRKAVHAG